MLKKKVKVYCGECNYHRGMHQCFADLPLGKVKKTKDTYFKRGGKEFQHPLGMGISWHINKKNDCKYFKPIPLYFEVPGEKTK